MKSKRILARMAVGATLAGLLVLTGCDGMKYRQAKRMADFQITQYDFSAIAETSFGLIDPKENIKVIVLPGGLDPRAVIALKRVHPTVAFDARFSETLPAEYFVVRNFDIAMEDGEAMATLQGQLGPVTNTLTAVGLPDCGRIYTVVFVLTGGDWYSPSYKVEDCSQSRVPVDAGPRP
jgi:hypothetical protein